jgi:hypothetical protein
VELDEAPPLPEHDEADEDHPMLHVPVKKKGSRKR